MSRSVQARAATECTLCANRLDCVTGKMKPADLQQLQPLIRERRFQRGESLLREGRVAARVGVVKVGSLFGYRRGLDGRQRPVGLLGRGGLFGLFGVFGQASQVSAVAAGTGRVCEVPAEALQALASRDADFAGCLVALASAEGGIHAAWSAGMRVRGVVNQLAYSLLLVADSQRSRVIELPTQVALAELLGTTRETIARSLAALEAEGSITRGERKQCEVFHGPLLRRLDVAGAAAARTATPSP